MLKEPGVLIGWAHQFMPESGFGFHTGLAYQFNDQSEVGVGFEKDYLNDNIDAKSWNLNINYLF